MMMIMVVVVVVESVLRIEDENYICPFFESEWEKDESHWKFEWHKMYDILKLRNKGNNTL